MDQWIDLNAIGKELLQIIFQVCLIKLVLRNIDIIKTLSQCLTKRDFSCKNLVS